MAESIVTNEVPDGRTASKFEDEAEDDQEIQEGGAANATHTDYHEDSSQDGDQNQKNPKVAKALESQKCNLPIDTRQGPFVCMETDWELKTSGSKCCRKPSFASQADLKEHWRIHIGHQAFRFKQLPAELRHEIMQLSRSNLTFRDKNFVHSLRSVDKDLSNEVSGLMFPHRHFTISGKPWLEILGTSRAYMPIFSDLPVRRLQKARAEFREEASNIWGHPGLLVPSTTKLYSSLFLNTSLAEHVRNWSIVIDLNQYAGEKTYDKQNQMKGTPSYLPYNFLVSAGFSRAIIAAGGRVDSIKIDVSPRTLSSKQRVTKAPPSALPRNGSTDDHFWPDTSFGGGFPAMKRPFNILQPKAYYEMRRISNASRSFESADFTPNQMNGHHLRPGTFTGGVFPVHLPCEAHHLQGSLLPFEVLRGIGEIHFGINLVDRMNEIGCGTLLDELKRKAESKRPYLGDAKQNLENIKELYLSFGPYHETDNDSLRRKEMDNAYLFEQTEYEALDVLEKIFSGANCRASYVALYDSILEPAKKRLKHIEACRQKLDHDLNDQHLWILFCSFQGITWKRSPEWSAPSVLENCNATFSKSVGEESYVPKIYKGRARDRESIPWSTEITDVRSVGMGIFKSASDREKGDHRIYNRSLWMMKVLEEGEAGLDKEYAHNQHFSDVLNHMDKQLALIRGNIQVCETDFQTLQDSNENPAPPGIPGVIFVPRELIDFNTVPALAEARKKLAVVYEDCQKQILDPDNYEAPGKNGKKQEWKAKGRKRSKKKAKGANQEQFVPPKPLHPDNLTNWNLPTMQALGDAPPSKKPKPKPKPKPQARPASLLPYQGPAQPVVETFETVTALYDFQAQVPDDLSFDTDDTISIVSRTDNVNEWWTGKLGGKQGLFPGNYVKLDL